jgi:hypothetical protein
MKEYKVYLIKCKQTDNIVYVGLTRQTLYKRFIQHKSRKKWKNEDYYINLVQDDLTLGEAVVLEEMLIEQYETRLCGFNKSPMSINGYSNRHSEEQKAKWSRERKGIKPTFIPDRTGLKNKPEHVEAMRKASEKPVICVNTGKKYKSGRQAAKDTGTCYKKVSLVCRGIRPHTKGYKFKFLPKNSL